MDIIIYLRRPALSAMHACFEHASISCGIPAEPSPSLLSICYMWLSFTKTKETPIQALL